jgi:hypothetical protein
MRSSGSGGRKGSHGDESRPLVKRGGAWKELTPEEMDRLTANMWTHPYAAIARSETLDAELAR